MYTLAVMPLQGKYLLPEEAEVLSEALTSQLQSSRQVRVIERSQMEKILAEQGFQKSGACDQSECAVEVGRIAGIDRMVVGSVGKLGNTWSVVARMVSVETGEILASAQDTREGQVDNLLRESIPLLARQLLNILPPTLPPLQAASSPLPALPMSTDNDRIGRQEAELSLMIRNKSFLNKKGFRRASSLSDSLPYGYRYTLYNEGSMSTLAALANIYPVLAIGSLIQKDWTGIGVMAAGYSVGLVMISRSSSSSSSGALGGLLIFGTWVYQVIRPISNANSQNAFLRNALQVEAFGGPGAGDEGVRVGMNLAY